MKNKESAGGIILNEFDEVILVFTDTKSWQFPKGTVEKGESYLKAAIREIKEETGIEDIKPIKKLPVYTRLSNDRDKKILRDIHYFLFKTKKKELTSGAEVSDCEWISINNVEDKLTYKKDKEFFKSIKEQIK
jgi:bis(5'-nucleosidyl)-tetraphosphatase